MKSKDMSEEDPNSDEVVPIPVQIFLWRQTTPFVRPRLGKVHDAACMCHLFVKNTQFCQRAPGHHEVKEACKSFEKVLVQNLRFGLSISLAEAIGSIPRWRLIQASLPHVMHALAALLHNRVKDNMQSLGNVETKLLYTLHWILLDASDECIEADYENGVFYSNPFHYLFSIPALTLFVFLFAPLSHHLKESDFTNNYRLENGLKMWQAMWEFRHPEAPCFTTLVKPKPKPLGGKYSKRHQPGDVFMGRKLSKEEGGGGNVNGSPPSQNVSISQSEVTSKQASTEEEPWLSSPKDTIFPETIPEESSSTEEEHVFIYRLPSEQNFGGAVKEAYTVYAADPSIFQPRKTDTSKQGLPGIKPLPQITKMSGGGGGGPTKDTPTTEKPPSAKQGNVSAATFLDVATMRCLFTSQWQEEGVYWALHYLYNRLRDICDDMSKQTQPRKRSNSLPIPKIEVSVYQSPDIKDRDSLKNFIEVPEVKDMSPITEMPFTSPTKTEDENIMTRRSSEKIKRKMKMADLKAFVETKLLSKSEKALEKIGHDDHKFSFHSAVRMLSEYHRSLDNTDDRPNSALASNFPPLAPRLTGDMFHCNLIKGKSMPSLRYIEEVKTERTQGPSHAMPTNAQKKKNPIITVTEHTPTPSPDYLSKTRQAVYSVSTMDSFYITLRVMEVMLNLVDTLMEMGVHKNWQSGKSDDVQPGNVDPLGDFNKDKDSKERDSGIPCAQSQDSTNLEGGDSTKERTKEEDNMDCPYYMIMHVILRLLRQLGCSHGCTTALRGPQAECLRVQARNSLRQLRSASIPKFTTRLKEMTKYAPIREVLDNLHAAVGFCAEPATLVSPMNQQKRNNTKSPDISNLQTGYATNFGAGQGPNASRAIETFIIETTFRVLVTRFALMHKELKMLDNSGTYLNNKLEVYYTLFVTVNWFRQKPHHSQSLIRNGGGSGESLPISGSMISLARPPHLPPPHTSRPVHVKRRVGYTLNRARKRVEDRLNRFGLRKMGKKRDGSIEDTSGGYMSRRGSAEGGSGGGESEVVILKRRRLVAAAPLYAGLARVNGLIGSNQTLQKLLALGNRLEEMLIEDKKHVDTVVNLVNDPDGQRELLQQDEEEDFLDEASIRLPGKPIGADCPRALRIIACVLLFEITAFLRETYQNLPKTCRSSLKERGPWDRVYRNDDLLHTATFMTISTLLLIYNKEIENNGIMCIRTVNLHGMLEANRRWSMALSSMGHSQASAQSLQSIAGAETERKISFVLHEPENVSGGSNVTLADAIPPAVDDKKGRLGSRGKAGMHRRNTQQTHSAYGSFKRRSIKLRQKDTRDVVDEFVTRRSDSIQSRRKVSSLSDRSDTSEVYPGAGGTVIMSNEVDSGGEESPGVMVKFLNSFNYVCCHQNFCHPYCFRRNMRASVRLMKSVQKIYGEKFGPEINTTSSDEGNGGTRRGRRSRKSSEHSTDRIERSVIESAGLAYRAAGGEQTNVPTEGVPTKPTAMPYPPADPPAILKYLKGQVRDAYHTPLATLIKGATTMGEEMFAECAPVAWQLLLESDRELSSCAAALFILAAVKAPNTATEIMHNDLKHAEPSTRINAILRFQVMWKLRYQVWPRMEEGASVTFKVPPPGIEFTLPSPKIGIESLAVVDPPWTPQVKDKDMEMTLNQERHRSLVTATKTRKKQQTEAIKRALQQRNDKKRAERESFLITTIPITRQAAREPALDHAADDHVDPPADEELVEGVRGSHHTQVASALFPSTLCSAVAEIVSLLDDAAVSRDGCSVYEVAYQVIWCCLVEDSALFLRHVLERLTRDHQDEMFKLLRHLIRFIPRLPQQAAFALYNYIIGYVMFYVRSPHEEGQRLVGAALSILWMFNKVTKQNIACSKLVLFVSADNEGCIPSQFPVQEDTVFAQILKESLDFFGIPEKLHKEHFLVDFKTRQIHNPQGYVRDHYFFKRSQYPQLCLVHMEPDEAFQKLQEQELLQKFVEIGKVLLTWAILKNVDMVVQRVVFLHDELMKLPSFPRKALEADLVLYSRGALGSTLLGLDVLHKFMWVRLIARMFEAMAGNFTSSRDIHLFLNVLNGALMLHSEDSLILRYVIATYVNAAFNFKSIFSTNGYLLIMPTLLQIYSNFQTNKLVTTTIEYAVKQFYLLNRKPFILQMFGSVSAILDTDEESTYGDASKVQSSCLFNLLLSLETPSPDPLHIAELIKEEKPLKPIDFCYRDEEEMVNVLDCISLCVMVVSYSAESMRGYQMLIILEAILPCYVKQIQLPTYNREGKTEKEIIQQLAIAIKTLVNNCEGLSKSYNGPYRTSPEHKGSSQRTGPRTAAATIIAFEESHSKYDNSKMPVPEYTGAEDSELVRAEYRRPRDVLLSLVGEFIGRATSRLLEINGSNRSGGTDGKPVELLDSKSHARLAEIAHSLLKVSPYDPESMGCRGLQRYMTQVLPAADWADDALRPALIMILRRLDKVFLKIAKKPSIRRNTDWDSAAVLLKGVYETMIRCPYIMHWQHVKTLLNTVQALIVSDNNSGENLSSATAALMSQPPPPHFCSTVVRLIALQIINTGDSYSLEQMCGGSASFPTGEKTENMLMNLFMPLCLRVGSGRKDVPPLRQSDVSYLVSVVLNALCPPAPPGQLAAVNAKLNASDNRANSLTFTGSRDARNTTRLSNQLYRIAFLALKVMCACFTSELCTEWGRIARAMRDLGRRNEAAHHLWDFLEHVLSQPPIGDNERHMQFVVRERVRGLKLPAARARGALLAELARELRHMRDTHDQYKFEQIAENLGQAAGKRASEVFPRTTTVPDKHQQHRPSLISMLVGRGGTGGLPRTPDHPSAPLSAQRESLSSSSTTSQHMPTFEAQLNSGRMSDNSNNNAGSVNSHMGSLNNYGSDKPTASTPSYTSTQTKLRFVPSVELKFTSGETSMSPLSPMSPGEASCGETVPARTSLDSDMLVGDHSDTPDAGERPRLQRAHGPSKKTFKFRRSRHTKPDVSHVRLESDDGSSPGPETTPLRRAWSQPPFLQPTYINTDTSYDSEISQTSSTSGYRLALPNLQ
ncbi:hypothetical protein HF086_002115 [Spodoptera exigua]|uniref:Protein unc-80 homolog n=1 Tax=Spodoptera exigua TaxID=7107 RepID=A0A922MN44_SPOEX|nr:hypothetical protein HF086_002115 [Spodoptera exigua]